MHRYTLPKMQILLTNDDGVRAPGILTLAKVASQKGRVVICAPDRERSGCGHAMTLHDPLRVRQVEVPGDFEAYEVDGVPVDCVNVALTEFFPNGCDLVISGFNNGPNLGWDATYSGTVGGALEGAVNGIRSFAISIAKYVEAAPAHFETARLWLEEWWHWLMEAPIDGHSILNINIPSIAYLELRGTRITTLGMKIYEDRVEKRHDPMGRPYYWQGGVVVMDSSQIGTDVFAVNEGFASITPIRLDWTHHDAIDTLQRAIQRKEEIPTN